MNVRCPPPNALCSNPQDVCCIIDALHVCYKCTPHFTLICCRADGKVRCVGERNIIVQMQSIIQAVLKFASLQEQLWPWQNVFEGSGCRRNCFRVAAPGTEPSVKRWKGATDQILQRELACAHRTNCHTVLETWSCPLPYQSLGSPKKPKVCMRSQLMHSIAESAPDGKVHGACRVHTALSLSPFLCPKLWESWQHPFGSCVKAALKTSTLLFTEWSATI